MDEKKKYSSRLTNLLYQNYPKLKEIKFTLPLMNERKLIILNNKYINHNQTDN